MPAIDFIGTIHKSAKRDYLSRVLDADKADCAIIAKQFGFEYFDGERKYGYGGFRYDGRWLPVAEAIVNHYALNPGARILDIGCGKGFLLHDFRKVLPGCITEGIDISEYAIANSMPEIKDCLRVGNVLSLPYEDKSFDLVLAINVLHNLRLPELEIALHEIERVGKNSKYVVNDSYRSEREKVNLLYWQLTCECFFTPEEWAWVFDRCGYTGDYGFIFFE